MATLTIQGSGVEDNALSQYYSTTNYNTSTKLTIRTYNDTGVSQSPLVRVSLSGLPSGAIINSATFSMYFYSTDGWGGWGETATAVASLIRRTDWSVTQSTWTIYKTSNNWGTAGCRNTSTDINTSYQASSLAPAINNWHDWDVKDIVEYCVSQSRNLDLKFERSVNNFYFGIYYSTDYTGDTSLRPKLVINYTVAPNAPTNVSATENNSSKVVITWTKSSEATNYAVLADGDNISGTLGNVATYDDTVADPPVITAGTASATKGDFSNKIVLSLSGESIADGTSYSYTVKAYNAAGWSSESSANAGYRKASSLSYQWQVSAGDSDASYSDISGATTASYNYTGVSAGVGRYYKCKLTSSGADTKYTTADRGYRLLVHTASLSDSVTLSESKSGSAVGKVLSASVSISDSRVVSFIRSIADNIGISDTVSNSLRKVMSGAISLSDSFSKIMTYRVNPADSISLSDSYNRVVSFVRSMSDSISLSESIGKVYQMFLNSIMSLSDSARKTFNLLFTDVTNLSDSRSSFTVFIRSFSDNISVSESFTKVVSFFRSFSDTLNLAENAYVLYIKHPIYQFLSSRWRDRFRTKGVSQGEEIE